MWTTMKADWDDAQCACWVSPPFDGNNETTWSIQRMKGMGLRQYRLEYRLPHFRMEPPP